MWGWRRRAAKRRHRQGVRALGFQEFRECREFREFREFRELGFGFLEFRVSRVWGSVC